MDYAGRLAISYYKTIATINSEHKVYLVQHQESRKIYVKKILDVYNLHIYEYLQKHCITGIPGIYDIYEENNQLTVIEEYISGTSLQEIADTGALTIDLMIQIMCELCDTLENLHSLNPPIIHRDIKPSNLILTPYHHAVLIDFNAAKYWTGQGNTDTILLGTKGYAAPEQYGFGSSTPQTDIYALGILLKELSSALPAPISIFDSIINKCTQMNPSDRIENVHKLKAEIQKIKRQRTGKPKLFRSDLWKGFLPPGFRTKTPWKALTASTIYLFLFWLSLSLEVKDVTVPQLWVERIICLFIMFSVVFCWFNYCNIQRFVPLCKSRHRIIRCLGILILSVAVIFLLFLIMFIIESIFSAFSL